ERNDSPCGILAPILYTLRPNPLPEGLSKPSGVRGTLKVLNRRYLDSSGSPCDSQDGRQPRCLEGGGIRCDHGRSPALSSRPPSLGSQAARRFRLTLGPLPHAQPRFTRRSTRSRRRRSTFEPVASPRIRVFLPSSRHPFD